MRAAAVRILLPVTVAIAASATPAAAREVLAPGLVHDRVVRPGPVVAEVLRLDRYPQRRAAPDGPLYRVRAVSGTRLSAGRTRLSTLVRERLGDGAVAGINGDYFSWSGVPSGLLLDERGIVRDPSPDRSAAVLDAAGALHVGALALEGSLTRTGPGSPVASASVTAVNRLPRESGGETLLYTPAFGARTPPAPGTPSLVLIPTDPSAPLIGSVAARVGGIGGEGGIGLPGRFVLALGGSRAAALAARMQPGDEVRLDMGVPALPVGAVTGIGGGPALVADGIPFAAAEGFTLAQTASRTARSALGQTRDGSLLLVTVEDGRSGPSRGVTSYELAQLMADLGAVTAIGLDSGGSAGISILGRRPASTGPGGERAIATALVVSYHGVRMPAPAPARVSPDGDGRSDRTAPVYRVTTRSAVRAALLDARGRRVARLGAGWRDAGAHRLRLPLEGLADGRYRVRVTARAEGDRRATRAVRTVMVNRTLGHLRVRGGVRRATVAFRLTRPAEVIVRVRVRGGWRSIVRRDLGPGPRRQVVAAPQGRRAVQVSARSRLGVTTLAAAVRIRKR